ncbi:unnamed protein product [Macrosiphum euphorbiae]|uniref:Uncharacterized protein n=1 Tax=Macrosiphum euphorbiae TaxID=13131 RepID=A0AAV0XVM6_9HEMI|nr:unnamed protein product [Macrosiphum euphorbiae]
MESWVNDVKVLNCTELQQGSIQGMDYNGTRHGSQRSITNQISSSIPSIPNMPNDECVKVWNILQSWNMEYVYETCRVGELEVLT